MGSAARRFVRDGSDRRLERVLGSRAALRLLFAAIARRFDPVAAQGFAGELQLDLRTHAGAVRRWTIAVTGDRARARPGSATAPALTVKAGLADFLRIAAGELDPGRALLDGRLDAEGDFALLTRAGAMFGAGGRAAGTARRTPSG